MTSHVLTAALPMYDWDEEKLSNDHFWQKLRHAFQPTALAIPEKLERSQETFKVWTDPALLFAQTCGLPYLEHLQSLVQILGVPVYPYEGCRNYEYSSRLVVRSSDTRQSIEEFKNSRLAINEYGSQSGCNAVRLMLHTSALEPSFFQSVSISGSHRQSIRLVSSDEADLCAIDPISWHLAKQHDPEVVAKLNVIDETPYTPGLPFICSNAIARQLDITGTQEKLESIIASFPTSKDYASLPSDIAFPDKSVYQKIKTLQSAAEKHGHHQLAKSET